MSDKKPKRVAIYARVSTDEQTTDNQVAELRAHAERAGWVVVAEYIDQGVSGAKAKRPALDKLLKAATKREFDVIAAWSVDRLGRSLQHLVSLLGEIHSLGIDLYLQKQALDTSTPSGRMMFGMLSVFAEFERAIISERVKAGMARVMGKPPAKGKKAVGRPRVTRDVAARVWTYRQQKWGINRIAKALEIGNSAVQRIVDEQKRTGTIA